MDSWGAAFCVFLASFLATVFGGLYAVGAFRKRKAKEPPLDKGFIPWLGHGLHFKTKPKEFLECMQKKHGDIFTVLVGGNYLHFVLDPCTYCDIIKKSKDKLDFATFGQKVVFNAFRLHASPSHHEIVKENSKKHLRGKSLVALNQVMMEKLKTVMLHSWDSGEDKRHWQQDGVLHFSYKTIFYAGFLALFGTEPDEDVEGEGKVKQNKLIQCGDFFGNFQKFDHLFPQMVFGILDPRGKMETQRLRKFIWDILSVEKIYQKANISNWIVEQDQQMAEIGMTEKMRTQFMFLLLWASQANTGPAAFWVLVHLLKYPEAMEAVRAEVYRVLRETGQEVTPGKPIIDVSLETIKTPLLDSTIEETLRLKASPYLFRSVMQDTDLQMSNGREYILRKGDHLLLFPFLGLHMDPEIYPDPHTFKYDRFLNPDGTKREFYKNGKKLKQCTMPFGGGLSICPGRFFAVSELKMFVILMLACFDMELVNAEEEIPPIDGSRCGFGIVHPSQDIQFKYRLRF